MFFRHLPKRSRLRPVRQRLFVEELDQRAVLATLTVNINADDTAADGSLSLREAIAAVNAQTSAGLDAGALAQITGTFGTNDTIQFAGSLTNQSIVLGSTLTLTQNVSIVGLGASSLTLDGNNAVRMLEVNSGVVASISGLTITKGVDPGFVGTIANSGNLTLTACIFTNNTERSVIYNPGSGTLTVESSTFSNNASLSSAAAILNDGGTLIVRNSTFSGNSAAARGAIHTAGTATISNSTFDRHERRRRSNLPPRRQPDRYEFDVFRQSGHGIRRRNRRRRRRAHRRQFHAHRQSVR